MLGPPPGVVGDDGVGGVEDRLGGAVVLLQHDDRGVGEGLLETQQVAEVGAPEAVDGLVGVAHHHDVAVLLGQGADEFPLGDVGVLELVDEDVGEAGPPLRRHVGMAAEEVDRRGQQVVEVEGRGVRQALLVLGEDLGDLLVERRERPFEHLLRPDEVVLGRRDGGVDLAGRQPLGVEVQVPQDVAGQADGVRLVVDRERRPHPEMLRLPAQDPGAGRVEGGHPHFLGHRADELADPFLHLVGGLVGEGDGQDGERRDLEVSDQVGDPVGQHPGLARPGPGHHQDRPAGVGDGLALHGIQPVQQRGRLTCGEELADLGLDGHRRIVRPSCDGRAERAALSGRPV